MDKTGPVQVQRGGGKLVLPTGRERPGAAIFRRIAIAVGCLVITTMIVFWERDGYRDTAGDSMSLLDSLYYATVTLSTTGYGDIVPVDPTARLLNILVITPLRFVFLIVLVGTTIEVLTRRTQYEWRVRKWRDKVSDHTVVIGYGITGRSAIRGLREHGTAADRIVVIAADEESVREATANGLTVVMGDASRESVLIQAGIGRAGRVVIATSDDPMGVLITMLVKRLSPNTKVVCVAKQAANAQFLRDSGADAVIVTAEAVGQLLSMSLISPTAGSLMEDLLDSARGLEVMERDVEPAEVGIGPEELDAGGQIVLAVIREGVVHRFDSHSVRAFNRGDRLVLIQQSGTRPQPAAASAGASESGEPADEPSPFD
ncbi:MAG: potassium channel family protein [Candidatus Nanopelagicales bacterium]|nr:potassium channel family protein [Candidatus Nanopelagicales bacterium]MDZ4248912.1 potassium channel family protein [Candidatus Nanopelagicales bacterium]